jgi:uncharacterized protein (DUF1684 family)
MNRIARVCLALLPGLALGTAVLEAGQDDYVKSIGQWREARNERMASPDGWISLVGLEWLEPGANMVGSAESSDARIPGGPEQWGTLYLDDDGIRFEAVAGSGVTVDGQSVDEADLVADNRGEPSVVRNGDLSFHVIYRESYALRIKDRKAPGLMKFHGVPVYEIQPDWRIEGRFIPAGEGTTVDIANVLGQTSASPVFGTFEFDRDGETWSLLALGTEQSESLWFLFADRTSGRETYGAGRFLYSEGMPEDGRLVVDFNKAYNPPCAFNDYSTCPLPPADNRLRLAVRAGEKKYHD